MTRRRLMLGFAALALAGCAGTTRAVVAAPGPEGELEALDGVRAEREGIVIRAASNGCTVKADFAFYVERRRTATTIAFARRRLDRCRPLLPVPPVELAFRWQELGLDRSGPPLLVLNPINSR
jgi:hypothetical protein